MIKNLCKGIHQRTNYILPYVAQRDEEQANQFLLNTLRAIYHSDRLLAMSTQESNEQMHVHLEVIAPATIVYMDTINGSQISYEEYERRYYSHIANKGVVRKKDEHRIHDDKSSQSLFKLVGHIE